MNWNIALDSTGGPHLGGCDTCTGLVTLQPDGTVTTDAEYYTIGHLSKFVKPGAVRIGSTSYGTTGWNGQTDVRRLPQPGRLDGARRAQRERRPAHLRGRGRRPVLRVRRCPAARSRPSPGTACRSRSRSRRCRWTGRPRPPRRTRPRPALAIDADGSTVLDERAGAGARVSTLQVDLGTARHVPPLAIDSGGNLGDYAARLAGCRQQRRRHLADAGDRYGRPASSRTSTLRPTRARYVRVTSTATSDHWWSLADLRLYR